MNIREIHLDVRVACFSRLWLFDAVSLDAQAFGNFSEEEHGGRVPERFFSRASI